MPNAEVMSFQEAEARSPLLLEWLDRLPQKARIKCLATLLLSGAAPRRHPRSLPQANCTG